MKARDLAGQRFGRLVAIRLGEHIYVSGHKRRMWECLCDCGNTVTVISLNLMSGASKSCGCLRIDRITNHGKTSSPEYKSWSSMIQRCTNPANARYEGYGARGIKICDQWMSFENFYADMGDRPSINHSLDRINNDGNYDPGNCRWATRSEQQRNKRPPRTDNAVRDVHHWTRKEPDRARENARRNIRSAHGRLENNSNAKMSAASAKFLRDAHASNPSLTLTEIGSLIGVGRETARKVIRGLAW